MLTVIDKINTGTASGFDGGEKINNQDKTITENGEYTADDGYTGLGTVTVNVSDIPAVVETLNVTPSTSAQTITASGRVDGYSPVNVAAVTASIDANIQAGNIKKDVQILGVTGTLESGDTITATNISSAAISEGDKVWIDKFQETQVDTVTLNSSAGNNQDLTCFLNPFTENKVYYINSSSKLVTYDTNTKQSTVGESFYLWSGYKGYQFRDNSMYVYSFNTFGAGWANLWTINSNGIFSDERQFPSYSTGVSGYEYYFNGTSILIRYNGTTCTNITDNYNIGLYDNQNMTTMFFELNNTIYNIHERNGNINFGTFSGSSFTRLSRISNVANGLNYAGMTSDNKFLICTSNFGYDRIGVRALYAVSIDFENNTISNATSTIFPAELLTFIDSQCWTYFNAKSGLLTVFARTQTNLNQVKVYKYNTTNMVFEDTNFEAPSHALSMVLTNIGHYVFVSGDLKTIAVDRYSTNQNVGIIKTTDIEEWQIKDFYKMKDAYNFDVIGSPTINNQTKTISGFSTSNYLKLGLPFNPGNNPWEVKMKFTTGNIDTTTEQVFFHSRQDGGNDKRYGICINLVGNKICFFVSSNGSSWLFVEYGNTTILSNTTYYMKFGWTGTQYYVNLSTDGETYTSEILYSSSSSAYNNLTNTYIGVYVAEGMYDPFLGSIDLSESYIKVNGLDWWVPEFSKEIDDVNVYYKGCASVNAGVASNLTAGLMIPDVITLYKDKSFELFAKVTRGAETALPEQEIFTMANVMLLRTSGTQWNPCFYVNGSWSQVYTGTASANTTYYVRCRYYPSETTVDGKTYTANYVYFEVSEDNSSWTTIHSSNLSSYFFGNSYGNTRQTGYIMIGSQSVSDELWKGSIDFNNTHIKVDGQIIWNGIEKKIEIDNTFLSGVAQENIAISSSGSVKTVLE